MFRLFFLVITSLSKLCEIVYLINCDVKYVFLFFLAGKLIGNRRHLEAACILTDYANVCISCFFCF